MDKLPVSLPSPTSNQQALPAMMPAASPAALAAAAQQWMMRLNAAPDAPSVLVTPSLMDIPHVNLTGAALPIQPEEHATALFLQQQQLLWRSQAQSASRGQSPTHGSSAGKPKKCPRVCVPCKRAKTACDVQRPCSRCVRLSQTDSCVDVNHKVQARRTASTPPSSVPMGVAAVPMVPGVPADSAALAAATLQGMASAPIAAAFEQMQALQQNALLLARPKREAEGEPPAPAPKKPKTDAAQALPVSLASPFSSGSSPDPIDFPWECLFDLQSIPEPAPAPASSQPEDFNADVMQSLFAMFGGAMGQADEAVSASSAGTGSGGATPADSGTGSVAGAPSSANGERADGAAGGEDDDDVDFEAEGLALPKKWPKRKPFNVRDYFASVFTELKRWKTRMLQKNSPERMRSCFIVYLRFYLQQSTMFRAFTPPELSEQKKELLEGLELDEASKNLMAEDDHEEPAVDMSESVTRLVYEKIPVAVVRISVRNFGIRVTYANPVASAMFGYDDGEVIKAPLCDELLFRAFHESEWHRFAKDCCVAVASRAEKFQFRGLFANKNGETFEAVLSVSITYSGRGIPKNATIFIQKSDVVRRDSLVD